MNGTTKSSVDSPGAPRETPSVNRSERHALLSSDTRRITLDVLVNSEAPLTLRELGEMVVEREQIGGSAADGIDHVALGLHHNHLPRMDGAGLIRYDVESNRVDAIDQDRTEQLLDGRF